MGSLGMGRMAGDSSSILGLGEGAVLGEGAAGVAVSQSAVAVLPGGDSAWDPTLTRRARPVLFGARFATKYFAQLDSEYEFLCPPNFKAQHAALVASFRAADAKHPDWLLNHRYELLLMRGVPLDIVRQRVDLYRKRLFDLVGPEEATALQRTYPAAFDARGESPEVQRTRALGLLSELQRYCHLRSEFDRLRNWLILLMIALAVPFVLAFSFAGLGEAGPATAGQVPQNHASAMVNVTIAGVFGGYFSVLLRASALRWRSDYAVNHQQVDKLFWNITGTFFLSMLEGGVAALILYTIFSAKLVEGSLFPSFGGAPGDRPHEKLWDHFQGEPKLIVWSVLAGFSERLVPDFLSVLQNKARTPSPPTADGCPKQAAAPPAGAAPRPESHSAPSDA